MVSTYGNILSLTFDLTMTAAVDVNIYDVQSSMQLCRLIYGFIVLFADGKNRGIKGGIVSEFHRAGRL